MGWPSLLDDINKRFDDDNMSDASLDEETSEHRLIVLAAIVRNNNTQLGTLLDLATDPSVDIAARYKEAQERHDDAVLHLQEMFRTLTKATNAVDRERSVRRQLEKENASMQSQIDALSQNDIAYMRWAERHSRPGDIKRHKPNA
ncbi:MAG: hypothetical protein IPH49_10980 [Ignavibacteria bacterium]|nr:hypothetical protein [Ignavibacteria bacterium]